MSIVERFGGSMGLMKTFPLTITDGGSWSSSFDADDLRSTEYSTRNYCWGTAAINAKSESRTERDSELSFDSKNF